MLAELASGLSGTLIFMALSFGFLIFLSYYTKRQRVASEKAAEAASASKGKSEAQEQKVQAINKDMETEDEELVAVITAAVAAMLGRSSAGIIVKSIKKLEPPVPIWTAAGRQDQVNSRF